MRRLITLLLVPLVALAACSSSSSSKGPPPASSPPGTAAAPTFPAGSTMDAIQKRGKLVVGMKFDQPLFGLKDPTSGTVEGFDADIAREMAKGIFGNVKDIDARVQFVETVSKNRETFISDAKVDIVVATYTINATRKQVVDFAGPYFLAHEDIMVKKDEGTIKSVTDLNNKKVCSAQGSTSIKNLMTAAPQADTSINFDTYSKCAEALGDGRVQAVVTDNAILAGLVSQSNGTLKLVNAPFSDEPYGIGLKKDDAAFRMFLNDRLATIEGDGTWKKLFTATVATGGVATPQPPQPDRY
ncbi:MAG: glutamate ABC transporter substrate-binding protein [Actinomycetota bacterium]|nr:glutamate ABC transporter substrate-binding protein [Actinomycetota bacterium]